MTPDPLLANHGIMHLHLGQPSTNHLLYLIQYADAVIFLELNDHKYVRMATLPSSQNLLAVHVAHLKRFEEQAARLPQSDPGIPATPADANDQTRQE